MGGKIPTMLFNKGQNTLGPLAERYWTSSEIVCGIK